MRGGAAGAVPAAPSARPPGPFAPAPDPVIVVERWGTEREPVVVIDGLLRGSDALVEFAATQSRFNPSDSRSFYPGLRAPGHPDYVPVLHEALKPVLAEVYGLGPDIPFRMSCAVSLVTTAPEQLKVEQRVPHVDGVDGRNLAILHYLCDPIHGGTGFFRHRSTGFETVRPDRADRFYGALRAEAAAPDRFPVGYTTQTNALFERIGAVECRFDRIILYRSCLLHSGTINPSAGLSADPRKGRLTANTFLTVAPA